MAHWYQIRIIVNDETEDAITNFLFELGCIGCQQINNEIAAYFSDTCLIHEICQQIAKYRTELASLGFNLSRRKIKLCTLDNKDWHSAWKKNFKPIFISNKLIIKPSWENLKQPTNAFVIEIDPKQAFGTGSHDTTRMILEFLDNHLEKNYFVLDVGTGTGILSITAVKLGALKVIALDIDPIAVVTAKENFKKNKTWAATELFVGEVNALLPSSPIFDLILANLNKKEILNLLNDFNRLLKHSRRFVITGILKEEQADVIHAIDKYPNFKIVEEVEKRGWVGLVVKKGSK